MRKLFVISDLHLGGRPDEVDAAGKITRTGYQICHAHAEIVQFVTWIMQQGAGLPADHLELVINGDLVDFLADDDLDDPNLAAQLWTDDEDKAIRKLDRIVKRCRTGPDTGVFESFRRFLAAGHRLTLLLGNHDIELSLPRVRQHLTDLLGGDQVLLKFIYDGEAYAVGPVLIEHGNRYDAWNMINHSALRQERSVRSRRLPVLEEHRKDRYFVVPAGTYLVILFMNQIKSRYRFVDLLKPETNAVVPLLVALEPRYRPYLNDIVKAAPIAIQPILWKLQSPLTEATVTRNPGNLMDPVQTVAAPGAPLAGDLANAQVVPAPANAPMVNRDEFVPDMDVSLDRILRETLGPDAVHFPAAPASGEDLSAMDWMHGAVDWFKAKIEPLVETAESASRYFGVVAARTDKQRLEQIHATLRHLNVDDKSFDLKSELAVYEDAARETAKLGDFQLITYGHTHLPKQVPLGPGGNGPPWYFNTGTWCDVMRLPKEIAADYASAEAKLLEFVDAIRANQFGPYIQRYLTYLEIDLDEKDGKLHVRQARLHSYCGQGRERSAPMTSVLESSKRN